MLLEILVGIGTVAAGAGQVINTIKNNGGH